MCIEEMSELTKELCKFSRCVGDKEKTEVVINNIREEIADVLNMVEQIQVYFGEKEIEDIREFKINRTMSKIKR